MSEIASIVQSPGWHCPVCDQRGSQHEPNCFVLELAAEVTQLQADLDAAENTSRLHERSWHLAEAEAAQLQADLTEAKAAPGREHAPDCPATTNRGDCDCRYEGPMYAA